MFTVLGSFLFETCFWIFFRAVGPFSEPCPFGLTHLEFSGLHCCLFVKVLASILSKFSSGNLLKTTNGEGGIWTLAPLLTTYSLSRGAPSASWVLLQTKLNRYIFNYLFRIFPERAEGGIRTHAPLRTNGFQDRLVMTTSIPLHILLPTSRTTL